MRDRNYWFIVQAAGIWITWFIFLLWFSIVGLEVVYQLKWRYMKAILTKDSKWYEETDPKQLPYLVNLNLSEVQNATGKTVGIILFSISNSISCIIVWMISGMILWGWMLLIVPFSLLFYGFHLSILQKKFIEEEKVYAIWGSNAEQALSSIKVVKAFNQASFEYSYYERHINQNDKQRTRQSLIYGISSGFIESILTFPGWYSMLIGGFFITEGVSWLKLIYRPKIGLLIEIIIMEIKYEQYGLFSQQHI